MRGRLWWMGPRRMRRCWTLCASTSAPRRSRCRACRASREAWSAISPGTRLGSSSGCPIDTPGATGRWASFALYKSLVAFDHVTQRIVLMANVEAGSRRAFESAQDTLDALQSDLSAAGRETSARAPRRSRRFVGSRPRPSFLEVVKRAQQHIAAGGRLSGGALAPFRLRVERRSLRRVSRASDREPVSVHVLSEGGRARRRRRLTRDAGSGRGRRAGDAPDRGHPAESRRGRRGRSAREITPGRREGDSGSTSCSSIWLGTTWAV